MQIKSVKYKEKERLIARALAYAKPLTTQQEFCGTSVTPFVGKYAYPNINVGILATPQHNEKAWEYDSPKHWNANKTTTQNIIQYRAGMINSQFTSNTTQMNKLITIAQEVAMAKTADIEVQLKQKPQLSITTNQWTAPMGPQAQLNNIKLGTTKIPTHVERVANDDILAGDAITTLYKRGLEENAISKMLSVGIFGKNKKLVPTRWSITATDDTIGKEIIKKIKDNPEYEYCATFGGHLGNYYLILFLPQPWSFELFEMYVNPETLEYSTDYETNKGRTNYADNTAGGYYTVRLAIAEHLENKKRQATTIALRFITDEYVMPLGVWVTREATRNSLAEKPINFATEELMMNYAKALAKKKFGIDIEPLLKKSKILGQKTLTSF